MATFQFKITEKKSCDIQFLTFLSTYAVMTFYLFTVVVLLIIIIIIFSLLVKKYEANLFMWIYIIIHLKCN